MEPTAATHDPYRQAAPVAEPVPAAPDEIPPAASSPPGPSNDNSLTLSIRTSETAAEEIFTVCWKPETPGAERARRRKQHQQWKAGQELAKLWGPYGMSPAQVMLEYTRNLGWDRMSDIYEAVHPLPWSVLRPLASLPGWTIWPESVSAPLTHSPFDAAKQIRQLPEDLERWRRLDAALGEAWDIFYGIWQRRCDDVSPGRPEAFLHDLGDGLETVRKTTMARRASLEEWAAGTQPGRLTGDGKSDGKAQNWARLRAVAIELALRINRAIPRARSDRRLLHGVLRTSVRQRMTTIIKCVYGVPFSDVEARDLLRKYVKERQKTRK